MSRRWTIALAILAIYSLTLGRTVAFAAHELSTIAAIAAMAIGIAGSCLIGLELGKWISDEQA